MLVGKVAPWFGTYGGGIQYFFENDIYHYLFEGSMRLIQ
ncbi:MAG TPA: hypothetical protein DD636_09565 [Anaerolineaceae bacterium]|nr:hypothetical protein [Anaerolineaceae bacterium]